MVEADRETVERLCRGASDGMLEAAKTCESVSVNEVFSAHMTLAFRAVCYAKEIGGNMEAIRDAIQKIYAELPPETIH